MQILTMFNRKQFTWKLLPTVPIEKIWARITHYESHQYFKGSRYCKVKQSNKNSNHPAFIDKNSHVFDKTIRHVRRTLDRDPYSANLANER